MHIVLYVLLAIILLFLVFLYFFPLVQICGYSMFPTMTDNEFYLGKRVFLKKKCKVGEIYVYIPPYEDRGERYVIKRLSEIYTAPDGTIKYYFLGDNTEDSYDSRYYGFVDSRSVVAHIVLKKRGVK